MGLLEPLRPACVIASGVIAWIPDLSRPHAARALNSLAIVVPLDDTNSVALRTLYLCRN